MAARWRWPGNKAMKETIKAGLEIANRNGTIKAVVVACSLSIHSFRERTGAEVSNGSLAQQ
jgi:hypothetical protein